MSQSVPSLASGSVDTAILFFGPKEIHIPAGGAKLPGHKMFAEILAHGPDGTIRRIVDIRPPVADEPKFVLECGGRNRSSGLQWKLARSEEWKILIRDEAPSLAILFYHADDANAGAQL